VQHVAPTPAPLEAFVERLRAHPALGSMVAHHRRLAATPARFGELATPLDDDLAAAFEAHGITRLWEHQVRGIESTRAGRDVLLVTPTASGKTLLFATAVLESLRDDSRSKALFLYPTKALARDQLAGFRSLASSLRALDPPRFEVYDGDTPAVERRRIRLDPPQVLITNPDMLHAGMLAHHHGWEPLLRDLRWIVLDELHVYRGLFGAHVHHILGRLQRICGRLGARPRVIAASATVGNPGEFARTLLGRELDVVERSGAPTSSREVLLLNPPGVSPYTVAVRVIAEAVDAGLRTIAFAKARRVTELLYTWLVQRDPRLRNQVAPYRAGYLPEERRRLERRLFDGDLRAVLTTSALELGIDVGGLDVCVLVGYPGSLISTWQRIGRVGRQQRAGLVAMVALPDALDQYVVHHPELLFEGAFEKAVLDPWNPRIAGRHLVCAAAEHPLESEELRSEPRGAERNDRLTRSLVDEGRLVQDAAGTRYYAFRRRPHREVNLRSAGEPYAIVDAESGRLLGKIDGTRVYHECHPGAIYLHGGRSHRVLELDETQRRVRVRGEEVDYYTVVLGDKETEILERLERASIGEFPLSFGRLRVTVQIREYQKKRLYDGEPIATHPLDVPPLIYETVGFWIELPPGLPRAVAERELHFMGGIHAAEHAMIALFPLLAISDPGDVGGISYTGHPQTGGPAVFIYDGIPGGAGLAEQGFREPERLLRRTLQLVRECGCEDGCPGCIQSPRCGNGNKPLDKRAAELTLALLVGESELAALGVEPAPGRDEPLRPFVAPERPRDPRRHGISRAGNVEPSPGVDDAAASPPRDPRPVDDPRGFFDAPPSRPSRSSPRVSPPTSAHLARPPLDASPPPRAAVGRTLVLDVETQRSADEVGGWQHTARMGLALAVVYDLQRKAFRTYHEADVDKLLLDLLTADRVVGFNLDRFDMAVLSAYTEWDLGRVRTLDLLGEIRRRLSFRISLAHLSEVNLGESKGGDGMQSLAWWKEGRIDLIERYCRKDVELTLRLYELGRERGYLLYRDHADRTVRVPVSW
jgi:DEAD/DEAH box helicase domain-containing protein